jgi:hypothetical protein
MCQSKAQGGQRCEHDTSENRRLRRKASQLRSKTIPAILVPAPLVAPKLSASVEKLKQQAEELRVEIYAAPSDPVERRLHDTRMEVKLTEFGMSIGDEADRIAGFHGQRVHELRDKLSVAFENDIEEPLLERQLEIEESLQEAYAKWDELHPEQKDLTYDADYDFEDDETLTEEDKQEGRRIKSLQGDEEEVHKKLAHLHEQKSTYEIKAFQEQLDKSTKAYIDILSQIRPLGGDAQWAEGSNENTVSIMKETVEKHYPSSWLEMHNSEEGKLLSLGASDFRANFNNDSFSETEDDGIVKNIKNDFTLVSSNLALVGRIKSIIPSMEGVQVQEFAVGESYGAKTGFYIRSNTDEEYNPEKHGQLVDGKPEGEGWELRRSLAEMNTIVQSVGWDAAMDTLDTERWVRNVTTTKKPQHRLDLYSDEIKKPKYETNFKAVSDVDVDAYNKAVSYHEFGHRMETIFPDNMLARQEKAFLQRRSGKSESEFFSDMLPISEGSEFAHQGGFATPYIGREYFNSDTSNYEVFTTGVEAVFGKSYGGLVGKSNHYSQADHDHRGFTLGTLAVL